MSSLSARLRQAITFQAPTHTRDSNGVASVSWATATLPDGTLLADVPAEVLSGPGREAVQSGQPVADVAARITCTWFPGGIDAAWRILFDGQVYGIQGIPDTDATGRREYRITCTAGANDGQ